ncbi:DUF4129 domain-containing protein [Halomicrococcus gelatinilyticus]|uniref:DUF4129 domain-containing protein n=1 Tax=Halomicrococcus gelatinilyticus TaxID=1702103 RepID=UPI002E167404
MTPTRRKIAAAAALLAVGALASAATALERSLAVDQSLPGQDRGPAPSVSLVALLYRLAARLLAAVGIEPSGGPGAAGRSALATVISVLAAHATELVVLATLGVAAVVAIAVAHRTTVGALLLRTTPSTSDMTGERSAERRESLRSVDPENEVFSAWLAMVRHVSDDPSRSRTPTEWASLAVDAGLDPDAVQSLTESFRQVRYGDARATEDRERRASENQERLGTVSDR